MSRNKRKKGAAPRLAVVTSQTSGLVYINWSEGRTVTLRKCRVLNPDAKWEGEIAPGFLFRAYLKTVAAYDRSWYEWDTDLCRHLEAAGLYVPLHAKKALSRQHDGPKDDRPAYLVAAPGLGVVKIGKSRNIERRMKSLQIGSPVTLQLVATLPRGQTEYGWHSEFDPYRQHGEWFTIEECMVLKLREIGLHDEADVLDSMRLDTRVRDMLNWLVCPEPIL